MLSAHGLKTSLVAREARGLKGSCHTDWANPLAWAQDALLINEFSAGHWQTIPAPNGEPGGLGVFLLRQKSIHTEYWYVNCNTGCLPSLTRPSIQQAVITLPAGCVSEQAWLGLQCLAAGCCVVITLLCCDSVCCRRWVWAGVGVLFGYTILFNMGIIWAHQYLDRESTNTAVAVLALVSLHVQSCAGACVADAVHAPPPLQPAVLHRKPKL